MTVCVAAICDDASILGASDRMITAGDVEFEPPQAKIITLTTSIAVMIAGDTSLQLEILLGLRTLVNAAIQAVPDRWLGVREVADWYFENYQSAKRKRAERALLQPLGLQLDTFISRQGELKDSLATRLAGELLNFEMPTIEAIIAGIDDDGAHIYVADNRGVTVRDSAGFASIGIGYWHANSQLMFARHAKWKPMPDTLFLTYAAKRRAEVAPGVGEGTDMFMIGPGPGTYFQIGSHVLEALQRIYAKTQMRTAKIQTAALSEVNKYVEELGRQSQEAAGTAASQEQPSLLEGTGATTPEGGGPSQPAGAEGA